jgi:hypothetical protein
VRAHGYIQYDCSKTWFRIANFGLVALESITYSCTGSGFSCAKPQQAVAYTSTALRKSTEDPVINTFAQLIAWESSARESGESSIHGLIGTFGGMKPATSRFTPTDSATKMYLGQSAVHANSSRGGSSSQIRWKPVPNGRTSSKACSITSSFSKFALWLGHESPPAQLRQSWNVWLVSLSGTKSPIYSKGACVKIASV